jgi:hypothetical protein
LRLLYVWQKKQQAEAGVVGGCLVEGVVGWVQIGQQSGSFATSLRNVVFSIMPSSLAIKQIDKYFGYDVTKVQV